MWDLKQSNIAADVLSEEVILKWYKDSHSSRGWSVFMDQMKKFVEWLEHAEEGRGHYLPKILVQVETLHNCYCNIWGLVQR